jgi:hypothetical protein
MLRGLCGKVFSSLEAGMGKRVALNATGLIAAALLLASVGACGDDSDGAGGASGAGTSGMGATGGTGGSGGAGASGMGATGGMGGSGGMAGGNNNVGPSEVCMRVAQIQCAAEADCCDAPGRDVAACESAQRNECEVGGGAAAADPIVGFDQDALADALDELQARTATCDPSVATWAITSDGFLSAFTGTRAAGADCGPAGGDDATLDAIAAALASCQNSATTACLPDLVSGDWTCAARSAAAGPCFSDLNCADGLFCNIMGTCEARKAAGAECDQPNECASLLCAADTCAEASDTQAAYCLGN